MYTRDEIRAYYKKNLQQVQVGGANKVTGSIKVGPTLTSYDLGAKCKTFGPDGMPNGDAACTNGGYVNTVVSNQLLLGYAARNLQRSQTSIRCRQILIARPAILKAWQRLNHPAGAGTPATCATCHTTQHVKAPSM